ncbi:LuxR C-terminal-related transcriptional regulator [Streptacidiphilus griseoplanus]|uniref:LuxR C-terminal-related transcriptional regulator n=1 Tax=Peterkaempfera griseoplana TaxID=66896 RepID=UPI000A9840A5|nr:LuxR C-terminal-related transcriptional regulator [Peterkaempfera griseoplana]
MSTLSYEKNPALSEHPRIDRDDLHLLALLATGLPVESVARRLHVSARTVRRRYRGVCDKLGLNSVIEAVAWAARRGLI